MNENYVSNMLLEEPILELRGWASIAEALLLDCARAALVDVEEPASRTELIVEYVDRLRNITNAYLREAVTLQRSATAEEGRRASLLQRPLHVALQKSKTSEARMIYENSARTSDKEEILRLTEELTVTRNEMERMRMERAAVWQAIYETHTTAGISALPPDASVEEYVHSLCAWVRGVTAELASAAEARPNTPSLVAPNTLTYSRPSYRRVLLALPCSPITASLLRVKEQVQQMREPAMKQLQKTVRLYRPLTGTATTPETGLPGGAETVGETPVSDVASYAPPAGSRWLLRSGVKTPHRSPHSSTVADHEEDYATPPPWRTHMNKLQEELQGLRRNLGTTAPSS